MIFNSNIISFYFHLLIFICIFVSVCKTVDVLDVTKFGADVKGVKKSTDAVKKAIDAAVQMGGGIVYFPNGDYLCGPIHLKTNITLELANNAIIRFSTDFDDYLPMVTMRWEGTELINFSPLIYAYQQENIAIKGKGVLDGQGSEWWKKKTELSDIYRKSGERNSKYQKEFLKLNNLTKIMSETDDMSRIEVAFLRPPFLQPFDSKNILIEDVTIRNSPFWNINPVFCENITIKGVSVEAPYPSPNTDGIDPDSCKDVLISNVRLNVGDDCIAIKSGRDRQGIRIGRPTENVLITDSHMLRGISGVAIGSEQSGGVRNVTVRNCVFNGTDRGIYIKSTRGRGGVVENIHFKNITMIDMKHHMIWMSMAYDMDRHTTPVPFSDTTPVFRDIEFTDLKCNSNESLVTSGLPESFIQNIKLSNITVKSKYGLIADFTTNLVLNSYSQTNY